MSLCSTLVYVVEANNPVHPGRERSIFASLKGAEHEATMLARIILADFGFKTKRPVTWKGAETALVKARDKFSGAWVAYVTITSCTVHP